MRNIFLAFSFLFLISFDLVSKYFAHFYLQEKIPLIWDFLSLELYKNPGIAFSFPLSGIALKLITLALIFGIIYYYWKEEKKKQNTLINSAFLFILSWAIWHGIERILFSEVTDFIAVKYFSVFNIADTFITIWGALFLWSLLMRKK